MKEFTANVDGKQKTFDPGTMMVHAGLQTGDWFNTLSNIVKKYPVSVDELSTGLTLRGIDLGSRNMMPVTLPNVLLIGGSGTSPYEVGETWYLLDRHLDFSPTIIEKDRVLKTDISKYTQIG